MNSYFNGLLYALCMVALVACGATETNTDENTGTDTSETTEAADTTDTSDTTDDGTQTDGTDTTETGTQTDPDETDGTDEGTDTTNPDTTDPDTTTDPNEVPVYSCPADDPLEDNDTNETATAVTPGSTLHAMACSLDGEYNHDNDVFVVSVDTGCTLFAEVLFGNADGDLDMMLTDATSGDLVGEGGQSEDDNEEMTYTATASGDVYISIFPYMSMGNQYVLNVNMACP